MCHILLYSQLAFKVVFVTKLFPDLQVFLTFMASKDLKLSWTLNCVLKRAYGLKRFSKWLVLLSRCVRNLKLFHVNRNNCFHTHQTHSRDINNKYLTNLIFSVRTVSYGPSFFPIDLHVWPTCFAPRPWSITYSIDIELS